MLVLGILGGLISLLLLAFLIVTVVENGLPPADIAFPLTLIVLGDGLLLINSVVLLQLVDSGVF